MKQRIEKEMIIMFLKSSFSHVNWTNAFQSVKDTWLPLFGTIVVIGVIIFIYKKMTEKKTGR